MYMPKTYKKNKKHGGVPISRRNIPRAERAYIPRAERAYIPRAERAYIPRAERASSSMTRPSYRRPIYSTPPPYQNFHNDDAIEEENNDAMDVDDTNDYDDTIDYDDEEEYDIPQINLEQDCETEERSPGEFESGISYETLIPSQTVKLSDGRCYSFQDVVNLYDRAGSRANFKSPYTRMLFTDADYDIVQALLARGIQPHDKQETQITITGGYRKKKQSFSKKNKRTSKKTKKRKTTKRKKIF